MKKIGITGSIASGKTTASKILSLKRGPLFSADKIVKDLYLNKAFKELIIKEFDIKKNFGLKNFLKKKILNNNSNIKKLEKLVHPLVRRKMKQFSKINKNKKMAFFEIPLLIENKLMSFFDIIIFIKARRTTRLKRFVLKGGERKLFNILKTKYFFI